MQFFFRFASNVGEKTLTHSFILSLWMIRTTYYWIRLSKVKLSYVWIGVWVSVSFHFISFLFRLSIARSKYEVRNEHTNEQTNIVPVNEKHFCNAIYDANTMPISQNNTKNEAEIDNKIRTVYSLQLLITM